MKKILSLIFALMTSIIMLGCNVENTVSGPVDAPTVEEKEECVISFTSTTITENEYALYSIPEKVESAVLLTATVIPDFALVRELDWSVSFVDAESTWASGKSVEDYVVITPTVDGANSATLVCKKAFGSQIKVTVTARNNSVVSASCTVDYAVRPVSWICKTYNNGFFGFSFDNEIKEIEYDAVLSTNSPVSYDWLSPHSSSNTSFYLTDSTVGTWDNAYTYTNYVTYHPDFIADLEAAGFECNKTGDVKSVVNFTDTNTSGLTVKGANLNYFIYSDLFTQESFTAIYGKSVSSGYAYAGYDAESRRKFLQVLYDWSQKSEYAAIYEVEFKSDYVTLSTYFTLRPTPTSLNVGVESIVVDNGSVVV